MANYWYTGGAPTSNKNGAGGLGTYLAALYFGGTGPTVESEEYNGTSWSASADYGAALFYLSGCGTTTAGLGTGGRNASDAVNSTYEYNGTSWAAGGDMINARRSHPTFGTQTAGCAAAGLHDSTAWRTQTEEYDGTTWTASNATVNSHVDGTYGGTQTAGLAVAGQNSGGRITSVEEYDGTSWAAGGAVSVAIYRLGGFGSQTAFIRCGGDEAGTLLTKTESYNGTSWATENSMPAGKTFNASAGNATNGLTVSLTVTYEWDPILFVTVADTITATDSVSLTAYKTITDSIVLTEALLLNGASYKFITDTIVAVDNPLTSYKEVRILDTVTGVDIAGSINQNSLMFGVTGFPSGQTVEYRIKNQQGVVIQNWTSVGVAEDEEITGYSTYTITNVILDNGFQGKVSWRINGTNYYAVEILNFFESFVFGQISVGDIEASTILAKEATVTSISTIATLLRKHATNKMTEVDNGNGTKTFTIFDDPPNEGNAIFTYTYTVATTTRAKAT